MQTLDGFLEQFGLTVDILNSENDQTRKDARRKLAEAMPKANVTLEYRSGTKFNKPIIVNGYKVEYSYNSFLTAQALSTILKDKHIRVIGLKINKKSVVKKVKPMKVIKTVSAESLAELAKKKEDDNELKPAVSIQKTAEKLAKKHNVDYSEIKGTGTKGIITSKDIQAEIDRLKEIEAKQNDEGRSA